MLVGAPPPPAELAAALAAHGDPVGARSRRLLATVLRGDGVCRLQQQRAAAALGTRSAAAGRETEHALAALRAAHAAVQARERALARALAAAQRREQAAGRALAAAQRREQAAERALAAVQRREHEVAAREMDDTTRIEDLVQSQAETAATRIEDLVQSQAETAAATAAAEAALTERCEATLAAHQHVASSLGRELQQAWLAEQAATRELEALRQHVRQHEAVTRASHVKLMRLEVAARQAVAAGGGGAAAAELAMAEAAVAAATALEAIMQHGLSL